MADRIFPNRIQDEALDSDLVFQGIDWDNFNERLAKAKEPKKMDDETKEMLKGLNGTSDKDAKDLSEVPDALRPSVEKAQEKAKKNHKDKDHKDKDHKDEDQVANSMGYKTSEKNRAPGYKQVQNIKKSIMIKVKN